MIRFRNIELWPVSFHMEPLDYSSSTAFPKSAHSASVCTVHLHFYVELSLFKASCYYAELVSLLIWAWIAEVGNK